MTADEWDSRTWETVLRLEEWQGGFVYMITMLEGWQVTPPRPSPGFDTSEGAGDSSGPDFNTRLRGCPEMGQLGRPWESWRPRGRQLSHQKPYMP
jgi:hypothetical protein